MHLDGKIKQCDQATRGTPFQRGHPMDATSRTAPIAGKPEAVTIDIAKTAIVLAVLGGERKESGGPAVVAVQRFMLSRRFAATTFFSGLLAN
jgi:hypothetical protein